MFHQVKSGKRFCASIVTESARKVL